MSKIPVFIAVKGKRLSDYFGEVIMKSAAAKVSGRSYKPKEIESSIKQQEAISNSEVLLLDIDFPGKKWIKFCVKMREKYPTLNILIITSYEAYINNKENLNDESLISGFISDKAQQKVIISAIETVSKGFLYRYGYSHTNVLNLSNCLNTKIQEMRQELKDDNQLIKIEKLSQIIDGCKERYIEMIRNLPAEEKAGLDADFKNNCIESLMVRGFNNKEISDLFNDSLETVRINRMKFIYRINGSDSMFYITRADGNIIELTDIEKELIGLIAEGYSNEEIAENCFKERNIQTVKTHRRKLKEKFTIEKADNKSIEFSMPMIIHALRIGLLRMETIEDDYEDNSLNNKKFGLDFIPNEIDELFHMIDAYEKERMELIKNLPAEEKYQLNTKIRDSFIESMIVKGYENWHIANTLNNNVKDTGISNDNIKIVRENRMKLIHRLCGANSINLNQKKREIVEIESDELKFIKLIAEGKADYEIAENLNMKNIEVRNKRKDLAEKYKDVFIKDPENPALLYITKKNGGVIDISDTELEYLKLIATGRTNEDIVKIMRNNMEKVKSTRRRLREKFSEDIDNPVNSISMIIHALQLGLIKLDAIEMTERKNK